MLKTYRSLLAALMLAAAPGVMAADFPLLVATEGGTLQGSVDEGTLAFKNIPYARAPLGDLRWRAPQPVQAWQGVRDASQLSPDCMQGPFGTPPPGGRHPVSEDCLYLNLWRPAGAAQKLPVMVWIHGGGYVNGGSSSLDSGGQSMAARGLVFVSFNYRLGRFGFFGFPALQDEHPEEAKGNYGLMDQMAALRWVKRNIAGFGGDPENVTVVGESAGGMAINMLLSTPAASGLFQRAIIQSGAGRKLPRERHLLKDLPEAASATTLGLAFAKRWQIEGQDAGALAALRKLSAEQVADKLNMISVLLRDRAMFAGPVVDGRLFPTFPETAFASGQQQRVPLLVGTTSWDLGLSMAKTPDEAFAPFGAAAAAARAVYDPDGKGDMGRLNAALGADAAMVEPARFVARAMAATGTPVYEYRFSYVLQAKRAQSPYGAQHATDVPFAFDRLRAVHGDIVTPSDERVADAMADYWANFARNGDPNGKGLPLWRPYSAAADQLLEFGADGAIASHPDPWRARLDLMERRATQ